MMTSLVAQPQAPGTQSLPLSSFFPKSKIKPPPSAFVPRLGPISTTIPNRAILSGPIVPTLGTVPNTSIVRPLSPRQSIIVASPTQPQPIPSLNIGSEGRLVPPMPLPYEKVQTTLSSGRVVQVVEKFLPEVPQNEVVFVIPQVAARSPPGSHVKDNAPTTSRFVQPINNITMVNSPPGQASPRLTSPVVVPTLAPRLTSPVVVPTLASPRLTSPVVVATLASPRLTSPVVVPTLASPRLTSPVVVPTLASPRLTSPVVVPTLASPRLTSPVVVPTLASPRLTSPVVVPTLSQNRFISKEEFGVIDNNSSISRQQRVIPVKSVRTPPKSPLAGLTVKLVASPPR
jgi:hypothetical protein